MRATHRTTLELTRDNYLTPRGDCIVGIKADKGLADLDERVKTLIRAGGHVYLVLKVHDMVEIIEGKGDPRLELSDPNKIIARKSDYIAPNTVMIRANKSARDLNRKLVEALRSGSPLTAYVVASDKPLEDEEILRIIVDP